MNYPKSLAQLVTFRKFSTSLICQKAKAGRYRPTKFQTFPLTYEMANKPDQIGHRKTWNSWNTTSLYEGMREPETIVDDIFIRKFMIGTWHNMFVSEIIIKRQHNVTRIGGIIKSNFVPRKLYFLIGYTEQLLSYWLKGPVKLELQVVKNEKDVVYKYI